MSEYDNKLTAETFYILSNKNNEYIILITIYIYRRDINNFDVKLIV